MLGYVLRGQPTVNLQMSFSIKSVISVMSEFLFGRVVFEINFIFVTVIIFVPDGTTEEKTKHRNHRMARGDRVWSFHNSDRNHRNRKECCRDATTGAKGAKVQKTGPSYAHPVAVDVQLCLKLGVAEVSRNRRNCEGYSGAVH